MKRSRVQSFLTRWKITRANRRGSLDLRPASKSDKKGNRLRNWVRAGMIALTLTIPGSSPYHPYFAHVALVAHRGMVEGMQVAEDFERVHQRRRVGVIAIERAEITSDAAANMENSFDKMRMEFQAWKKKANPTPEQLEKTASEWITKRLKGDDFIVGMGIKSLVHNVPLRFIERYDYATSRRMNEIHQSRSALYERALKSTNIVDLFNVHMLIAETTEKLNDIRNPIIEKTMRTLAQQFGKNGIVYAEVGANHFPVAERTHATKSWPNISENTFVTEQQMATQPREQCAARLSLYTYAAERIRPFVKTQADDFAYADVLERIGNMTLRDYNRILLRAKGKTEMEITNIILEEAQKLPPYQRPKLGE